jgi:hypothetical protein
VLYDDLTAWVGVIVRAPPGAAGCSLGVVYLYDNKKPRQIITAFN